MLINLAIFHDEQHMAFMLEDVELLEMVAAYNQQVGIARIAEIYYYKATPMPINSIVYVVVILKETVSRICLTKG
jgi:hypothetical protein